MSAICQDCGRRIRIVQPAGGDGSAYVYIRHKNRSGVYCTGSRWFVPFVARVQEVTA